MFLMMQHPKQQLEELILLLNFYQFSQLPFRYPDISEVDLNPVFVFSEGLVVGDVLIINRSK